LRDVLKRAGRLAALVLGLGLAHPAGAGVKPGEVAPPFKVTTFGGDTVSLEDLKGQVEVLNYWATWCAPCRVELPILNDYYRRHPRHDLKILAVTVEDSAPPSKLKLLAAQLNFPLIAKLSGKGYGRIKDAVPTSYVIDRAGIVRYAAAGAFTAESFENVVGPLLNEPPPKRMATSAAAPVGPPKPVWVELPNATDLYEAYPAQAKADNLSGKATVGCMVNWDGGLVSCSVVGEEPPAGGFGQAALALTPKFRMQTAYSDGSSAVGQRLYIPIRFVPIQPDTPVSLPQREVRFAPTPPAFRRFGGPGPYYPDNAARAGASGQVSLDCEAAPDTGRLSGCTVALESPQLHEFGAAALKMAQDGWITAAPGATASSARRVRLSVVFKAPAVH
jgi:cytochrome c biogenesis protein CcmG/thiol:disulfide interchange protein DsbE